MEETTGRGPEKKTGQKKKTKTRTQSSAARLII